MLTFLKDSNANALGEIAKRFLEALDRGLWQPKLNSAPATLMALTDRKAVGQGNKFDAKAPE